jgi:hypothetical protein
MFREKRIPGSIRFDEREFFSPLGNLVPLLNSTSLRTHPLIPLETAPWNFRTWRTIFRFFPFGVVIPRKAIWST